MFITAFSLGFFGSAGHCIGMCGGVTLVLARSGAAQGWRLLLAHVGRIMTYGGLGAVAGSAGLALGQLGHDAGHEMTMAEVTTFNIVQGSMALLAAVVAVYMALALIGRLPSPELYLTQFTRRWSGGMRQIRKDRFGFLTPLVAGLLWGLLPCGLVLTALLTAALAATPLAGALVMVTFGIGTWPILIGMAEFSRHHQIAPFAWMRTAAAVTVCLFGVQFALRGFAAWGWISHFHLGSVVLW